MSPLSQSQFTTLLAQASVKPRLKSELRFVKSTAGMSDDDWRARELLAITDRSGTKGVLLLAVADAFYILPYEMSAGITSKSGQAQPIVCDFCRTWQSGTCSGSIRLPKAGRSFDSYGYLCCADLLCSLHVRGLTSAARISRSQLREDLLPEQRVERLATRIEKLVTDMALPALYVPAK